MAVTKSSTEAINNQTKTGQGGGGVTGNGAVGGGGGRAGSSEAHYPKKDRMKWAVRLLSWVPILACLSLCAVLAFRLVSLEAKVEVIQVMIIYKNRSVKMSFYHLMMDILRFGICGFFFLWLWTSRTQVITKKSSSNNFSRSM